MRLKFWKIKKERDVHLAILEEELKIVREKDEYIIKFKKSPHASSFRSSDSHAKGSLMHCLDSLIDF